MNNQIVTLKELAFELKTSPKGLRKWLRDNKFTKPGKRWEWNASDPQLAEIKEQRKAPKKKAPKAEVKDSAVPSAPKKQPEAVKLEPFILSEVGSWKIWKDPKNESLRAVYEGPKTTDKTPWITEADKIRKTLPKKVKAEMLSHLPN